MDDLIRRSEAIEALIGYLDLCCQTGAKFHKEAKSYNVEIATEIFEELPAIEPKQKGEWIPYKGMQPPEFHGKHYCSNCYHGLHLGLNGAVYNYCPNCGSRNKINTD